MTTRPSHRQSLRAALLLALVPLCILVLASSLLVSQRARAVHLDVQRLYEENHELGLARSLLEELRGIEQWVAAADAVTAAARPLIRSDQLQHLTEAETTARRFRAGNQDPSRPEHKDDEDRLVGELHAHLAELRRRLAPADPGPPVPIAAAMRVAERLAEDIEEECRELGHRLDQDSERVQQLVSVLGIASAITLALLATLVARRVLRPIRALHAGAEALSRGDLQARIAVGRPDEFGALARAFNTMAEQLQSTQQGLEDRVEQRSREVLRTARLAELGTLAAGIAHEINNPLASIAACAEGLLRARDQGPPDAEEEQRTREYLTIVAKEAMRARDITTRLLHFARQEPGSREPMHLAEPVREVVAMFAHQAAQKGVTIQTDLADAGGPFTGSAAEWRQVVYNLLKNALDATPAGGTIAVTTTTTADRATLTVADSGPGVPAELRERVFEPFFTTKAPGEGTGLGLPIVHRIVTAHGGHIRIGDRPGGGCRITVDLPKGP